MKLNHLMKGLFFFAMIAIILPSCESDDPIGGGGGDDPSISISSGVSDFNVLPGEEVTFTVTASSGDAELNTIAVRENGTAISTDNFKVNGADAFANPILLVGADRTSLTYEITIVAHSDVSTKAYSVVVTDADNKSASAIVNVTTDATPPSITYMGNNPFVTTPDLLSKLNINATPGTGQLSTIAIYAYGELVADITDLKVANVAFDANPFTLPDNLKGGFDDQVCIRTPRVLGSVPYTIEVTDEFGNKASVDVEYFLTTVETIEGVLLNQAGPSGTGGLDLDTGTGTGSADSEAEIRDRGIDTNQGPADNWLQQISAANDAVMKYVIPGQNGVIESLTFDDVLSQQDLEALFSSGVDFTQEQGGVMISNKVNVGDFFIVNRAGNYYFIEIVEVNVTTDDNSDSYRMNIKK